MDKKMKHAYLIMAHDKLELLELLIQQLDYPNNIICLHIDIRTRIPYGYLEKIQHDCKNAKIITISRRKIIWGGSSQIKLELDLLQAALRFNCDYYHSLSGHDFPIKSHQVINTFFENNNGKEFIHTLSFEQSQKYFSRYSYYHFFRNMCGRNRKNIFLYVEFISIKIQMLLNIKRKTNSSHFFGSSWFSITHDLAHLLIDNKDKIINEYKFTECCDEIFLQSFVMNSKFKPRLYHDDNKYSRAIRYIDWYRGNPYTFQIQDFNTLIESPCLFCRKVNTNTKEQIELINKLIEHNNNEVK